MRVAHVLALSFAVLAYAGAARADHGVDPATISAASSAAQHQALAKRYREHASEAKRDADAYRAMAKAYTQSSRPALAGHCQQIATEYQELAAELDALADAEAALGE